MSDAKIVLNYYNEVMKKKSRVSNLKIIEDALKKYSIYDLKKAIDGCASSAFHMGDNPQNKKYNTITFIFKINSRSDKVKFFMDRFAVLEIISLKKAGFSDYESQMIYNFYGPITLDILKDNPYKFLLRTDISFRRMHELFGEDYNYTDIKTYYYVNNFENYKGYSPFDYSFDFIIKDVGKFCVKEFDKIYTIKRKEQTDYILKFLEQKKFYESHNIDYTIPAYLNDKQQQGLLNSKNGLSLINGSAGTGKTTVIKEIINNNKPFNIGVTAFTGKACEVINRKIKCNAMTIHKLLGYNPVYNYFEYNQDNKLDIDLLIVDETSMINDDIFYSLICALKDDCRIVLVGDTNQIEPIGYGQPFKQIINKIINITTLNKIERQSEGSDIVRYSNLISNGNLFEFSEFKNDFYFINSDSDIKSLNLYNYLISNKIPKVFGYDKDDIQTLTTVYNGEVGIKTLNAVCKNIFNSSNDEYSIGDKVMQLKNNYNKGVMNGTMGKVVEINSSYIHIDFEGNIVKYRLSTKGQYTHSYCISVHKSQGSEFKCAVFVIDQNMSLIDLKILYTAITRAQELCIVIGNEGRFFSCVKKKDTPHVIHKIKT